MEVKELDKQISGNKIERLYFFYGDEQFLLENKLRAIKKRLVDKDFEEFNYVKLDAKKITADTIITELQGVPVMSDKKLVVVKNCGIFSNAKLKDFEKLNTELMMLPDYICVIFVENEFDKKKEKNLEVFKNHGAIVKFDYLTEAQLTVWIEKLFEDKEKRILNREITTVIRYCGQSMGSIYNECSKLLSYLGERTKVTAEDVEAVVCRTVEARIFDMLDNIADNKGSRVFEELNALIAAGENASVVLTLMTTRLSELLMVKQLVLDGLDAKKAGAYFEPQRPPFVVNKLINQSKKFGEAYLRRMTLKGLRYASDVRSGLLDKWAAVEMYTAELVKS